MVPVKFDFFFHSKNSQSNTYSFINIILHQMAKFDNRQSDNNQVTKVIQGSDVITVNVEQMIVKSVQ